MTFRLNVMIFFQIDMTERNVHFLNYLTLQVEKNNNRSSFHNV